MMFWCPCDALAVMPNRWNQYNVSTLYRLYIYMGAQVNSSAIVDIYWLIQTFKYQSFGFHVQFKSILVYSLKTKSSLWPKCPHCITGYITNLGPIFFLFALVLNLADIDYSVCQIESVYMHYLRFCDYSNKCLFLVIQQAEVLLNFFWWVYTFQILYWDFRHAKYTKILYRPRRIVPHNQWISEV